MVVVRSGGGSGGGRYLPCFKLNKSNAGASSPASWSTERGIEGSRGLGWVSLK